MQLNAACSRFWRSDQKYVMPMLSKRLERKDLQIGNFASNRRVFSYVRNLLKCLVLMKNTSLIYKHESFVYKAHTG